MSYNNDPYYQPTETTAVKISKENRKVYNGFLSDGHGNPNIRFYGYILEELVPLFGLYLLLTHKYKYSAFFILFFALGSLINGIRFYYVNPFSEGQSDADFLGYIIAQNAFNFVVCVIALVYVLFFQKK
jgi:hypothetical protein